MSSTINTTAAGICPHCFNSNVSVIRLEAVSDRDIVRKCVCESCCWKCKEFFKFDNRVELLEKSEES